MRALQAFVLAAGSTAALALVLRRMQKSMDATAHEKQELLSDAEELKRRNDQLTALYNVFSEITESLSLHYVVNSTLRETLKLMHADMAVLRVLRGTSLEVLGAMSAAGVEIEDIPPVAVGYGPTGKAAKTGKPVILDRAAEATMSAPSKDPSVLLPAQQTGGPPQQSGVIMPLVVGARVVGTLSCWSTREAAFQQADQRILEMLASQVATALVAADAMETSERRARHDALTDLPNRHQLNEDLSGDLHDAAAAGRPAVVAMIDIDHFKVFNDRFGHHAGDVTLQQVASVMRASIREKDRIYRYGGEEFVLVFADASAAEARDLAERVRLAVEATPHGEGDSGSTTVSIGLACLPDHGTDFANLIERADEALYRAKQAGRNRVVMWTQDTASSLLVA